MKNLLLALVFSFFYAFCIGQNRLDSLPKFELTNYDVAYDSGKLIVNDAKNSNGPADIILNEETQTIVFNNGKATINYPTDAAGELLLIKTKKSSHQLYHIAQIDSATARIRHIPLWLSLLPPLIAIGLALIFKEVILSLFVGVWTGAFIAGGLRLDSFYYLIISFFKVVEKYIINALNDGGHLSVIVFSLLIGGMVAIISRNGGMAGVVNGLSRYARSPRSSQLITWVLGVAIFFDDYANTLIVGNTMRPVTDKFKVSREKLAYIVDSTAAPVAAVAFVTTWIGAELGYIADGIEQLNNWDYNMTAYAIFISSLKYSFYPILTLAFILMLVYQKKDYGPMLKAETRARTTGKVSGSQLSEDEGEDLEDLSPVKNAPLRWYNAVIPVVVVILTTLIGLVDTGFAGVYSELQDAGVEVTSQSWGLLWQQMDILMTDGSSGLQKLGKLIGLSDSYVGLLWASTAGVIVALILTWSQRIMKLHQSMDTLVAGFKTMMPALIILTMAWALAATTEELHTATYLTYALQDSINPYLMPMLIFILSAFIAFSTGSSWSTMAILYPIAVPTTWAICMAQGIDPAVSLEILLNVISVTLAASVLGDHCSPISDTTILSSLASQCNHLDHVKTQMPYALTVGLVSLILGGLSTFLGGGWGICFALLLVGLGVLYGVVWKFGRRVD